MQRQGLSRIRCVVLLGLLELAIAPGLALAQRSPLAPGSTVALIEGGDPQPVDRLAEIRSAVLVALRQLDLQPVSLDATQQRLRAANAQQACPTLRLCDRERVVSALKVDALLTYAYWENGAEPDELAVAITRPGGKGEVLAPVENGAQLRELVQGSIARAFELAQAPDGDGATAHVSSVASTSELGGSAPHTDQPPDPPLDAARDTLGWTARDNAAARPNWNSILGATLAALSVALAAYGFVALADDGTCALKDELRRCARHTRSGAAAAVGLTTAGVAAVGSTVFFAVQPIGGQSGSTAGVQLRARF